MKKKNKSVFKTVAVGASSLALVVVSAVSYAPAAFAQIDAGLNAAGSNMNKSDVNNIVADGVNLFLYIIGIVAVVMIIFGGFQYLTSAGDPQKAGKARNTILYSVIGLLVAVFAFAIVNFVLDNLGASSGGGGSGGNSGNNGGGQAPQ